MKILLPLLLILPLMGLITIHAMELTQPKKQIYWNLLNHSQHAFRRSLEEQHELDMQLWHAVDYFNEELVKKFLFNGANPKNVLPRMVPPLHLLVRFGYEPCVVRICKLLLAYGADPNVRHGDETPLMILAQKCRSKCEKEMCSLLLAYGANPNLQDKRGNTALMYAEDGGISKILLNAGANVFTKNHDGCTTLHLYVSQPSFTFSYKYFKLLLNRDRMDNLVITLLACLKHHQIASVRQFYELQRHYRILTPYLLQYTPFGLLHAKNNAGQSAYAILTAKSPHLLIKLLNQI